MAATTIADELDFLPLFPEDDEDAILARCIEWANEGLDPDSDRWVDTREGGHWRTQITPCVRELARLYDLAGSDVPASSFVLWTWGTYLDDIAEALGLERLAATPADGEVTFAGADGTVIDLGTTVSVAPASAEDEAPSFLTTAEGTIGDIDTGLVTLPIRAAEAGEAGNVSAGAITEASTPLPAVTSITNAAKTEGGTNAETDEALRTRVLQAFEGRGGGNKADYMRWAGDWPGVGRVTVIPVWDGPNTVLVIVTAGEGVPASSDTVDSLQLDLDPVAGKGEGTAPIGATVTVETAAVLTLDIAGTVEFEQGYSMDGFGGTIALRSSIVEELDAYAHSIPSGGEAVIAQIEGRIVTVEGVHDVGGVTVNGGTVNVAVDSDPAQVAELGDTSGLVEGAV